MDVSNNEDGLHIAEVASNRNCYESASRVSNLSEGSGILERESTPPHPKITLKSNLSEGLGISERESTPPLPKITLKSNLSEGLGISERESTPPHPKITLKSNLSEGLGISERESTPPHPKITPKNHFKEDLEMENPSDILESQPTPSSWVVDMSAGPRIKKPSYDEITTKKNIFSMFVGLDDTKKSTETKIPARLQKLIKINSRPKDGNKKRSERVPNQTINRKSDNGLVNHNHGMYGEASLNITNDDNGAYVKLSDLDKPIKNHVLGTLISRESDERMSASIPNSGWRETDQTNNFCDNLLSSFHSENALSLNRLFPNLKTDFSRSLPGSLSNSRSPVRLDLSSSYSDIEEHTGSESSNFLEFNHNVYIENCHSSLGQDLLKMFIQGINTDVVIEAAGRRLKAHKCILASRCPYFAGILSGNFVTNCGNLIVMPEGYSYSVVHFTLCHLYSGITKIPENLNVIELLDLTNILGLDGLKDSASARLQEQYCHNFHKPCAECKEGVLKCLSKGASVEDLTRKCLAWIAKYFEEIWPTRNFAIMSVDLLEKCFQEQILNLTIDNASRTVIGIRKILSSVQSKVWSVGVRSMCDRLMSKVISYVALRLEEWVRSTALQSRDPSPLADQALQDFFKKAIQQAHLDQLFQTYALLAQTAVLKTKQNPGSILDHYCNRWLDVCEATVIRVAPSLAATQAYKQLPSELRTVLRRRGVVTRIISYSRKSAPSSGNPVASLPARPYSSSTTPQGSLASQGNSLNSVKPIVVRMTKAAECREKFNNKKKETVTSKPRMYLSAPPRLPSRASDQVPHDSESSANGTSAGPSWRSQTTPVQVPPPSERFATITKVPRPPAVPTVPDPPTQKKVSLRSRGDSKSKIPTYVPKGKPMSPSTTNTKTKQENQTPKSSKAKAISKVVKDTENSKVANRNDKEVQTTEAHTEAKDKEIPIMERSGTFLKDEAMFRDIDHHDIDNDYV